MEIAAPIGGGHAPVIASIGPVGAPKVGAAPPKVPKPKVTNGPNPGGLASPENRPPSGVPRGATPPRPPKSAAGKVGAARAAAGGGLEPLSNLNPNSLSKIAAGAASKIYSPIMANYNAQLSLANGLAQKRTADVTAFGQWYTQQQQALAAEETTRQTALQGLLGQLGNEPATTPQNGVQSSIGTNMNAPSGGAVAMSAAGNNAASTGVLSSDALNAASETNNGDNLLTALGGSYNQNMMSTISADLVKTDTAVENAQSKAYTDEGNDATKIDTNMTSYLNDQNKNIVGQNKNIIQGNYDQQQADTKALNAVVATASTLGHWTPALTAQYNAISQRLSGVGATARTGPSGLTAKGAANAINEQKVNQTAYENVTRRLAVAATNTKTADTFALGQIKNNLAAAATGAKVTVSNAEAKYYAARTGMTVSESKADLIKAYAYAQHYGTTGGGRGTNGAAGVIPLTTDAANSALAKSAGYESWISNVVSGNPTATKGMVNPPTNQKQMRQYINTHFGDGGTVTASLMWAAFDQHFYGGITPRTQQMLMNNGFSRAQLSNYKVINPKVK